MLLRKLFALAASLNLAGLTVASAHIPKRDYDTYHYFVVDIDTSESSQHLTNFIKTHQNDFKFEHQVAGLDDHYVFSIRKDNPASEIMGSYNVGSSATASDRILHKRDGHEELYNNVVSARGLNGIHWMEPKTLRRRMPVPIEKDDVNSPPPIIPQAGPPVKPVTPGSSNAGANAGGNTDGKSSSGGTNFVPVDASQEPLRKAMEDLSINDPSFHEQWHLINTNFPGHDINVTGLWYEGITGEGIVAAVIDDGLDYESPDLADNFNKPGSWDFNDNQNLPFPKLHDDYHGTRCAGEIGAVKNDVCGVGVAHGGQVAGIRILSGRITSDQEASAMMYGLDVNDIYSCSWGPTDDGKTLAQPDLIVKRAMLKSIQKGRKDKGSIYVFASGNGGGRMDSCNFDGYTNSIYSITVGAIDHKGAHPAYAEACSAVMVVTYSSGSGEYIHTTDIRNKCASRHSGTSAAAPIAAGIFQLVLQMNPNLTWRDLQYVCAMSSVPVNENDGNYQINGLGRKYSHKYGYGKLDAYELAHFAKTWKNVKPQAWYYSDVITVGDTIDSDVDGTKVITSILNVTQADLEITNLERVEHITVTVNIDASFRGRVGMRITSPFGVISDLATFRPGDTSGQGFVDWTFMSVAHWGETGVGEWKLEVFSSQPAVNSKITFKDYQVKLFGESADAEAAEVYDITKDYAAERRDKQREKEGSIGVDPSHSTEGDHSMVTGPTELPPALTETEVATATNDDATKPTEVNDNADVTQSKTAEPSSTSTGTGTSGEEDDEGKTKHYTSDHTGQYFMAIAVVGFIVVVLFMRFHKTPGSTRRRRREEYEFDIIPGEDYTDSEDGHDDDDSLDLGRRNNQSNRRTSDEERDRLYDEFNADTLPVYEDEMFKIGDEDEDHQPKSSKNSQRDSSQPKEQPQQDQEQATGTAEDAGDAEEAEGSSSTK